MSMRITFQTYTCDTRYTCDTHTLSSLNCDVVCLTGSDYKNLLERLKKILNVSAECLTKQSVDLQTCR